MKETISLVIGGCLAIAIICCACVKCSQLKKDALNTCIQKTGNALECKAAFQGEP